MPDLPLPDSNHWTEMTSEPDENSSPSPRSRTRTWRLTESRKTDLLQQTHLLAPLRKIPQTLRRPKKLDDLEEIPNRQQEEFFHPRWALNPPVWGKRKPSNEKNLGPSRDSHLQMTDRNQIQTTIKQTRRKFQLQTQLLIPKPPPQQRELRPREKT